MKELDENPLFPILNLNLQWGLKNGLKENLEKRGTHRSHR